MESVFKPTEDLIVSNVKPLEEFGTEQEELLLFQCPISQFLGNDDWNNVEVVFAKDQISGRFENSSGKEIELVSSASQGADAIVYLPSDDGSKLVEKVFRQVSLVRYPEPKELLETMKAKTRQKLVEAATDSAGKVSDPSRSSRHKSGQSRSSRSSKPSRSMFSDSGRTETPKSSKRKHSETSSGKHWSSTSTVSGSSERSGKSKKKLKKEE